MKPKIESFLNTGVIAILHFVRLFSKTIGFLLSQQILVKYYDDPSNRLPCGKRITEQWRVPDFFFNFKTFWTHHNWNALLLLFKYTSNFIQNVFCKLYICIYCIYSYMLKIQSDLSISGKSNGRCFLCFLCSIKNFSWFFF